MTQLETVTDLKDQTLEALQDLTRINQDSADGFRQAAEAIENEELEKLFTDIAEQRQGFSNDLRRYVRLNDEDSETAGSWKAKLHRWWLDLRGKLSVRNTYAVLAEAERGEDVIKQMYEDLIKQTTGNPLNDVLHEQYVQVKRGHDLIRDLRDVAKEAKASDASSE